MTLKARSPSTRSSSMTTTTSTTDLDLLDLNAKSRRSWRHSSLFLILVSFSAGLLVACLWLQREVGLSFLPFSKAYRHRHVYDVVIIGAGWAGLSAAYHLKELGITNIQILEARDAPGGRSRTVHPFPQQPDLAVEIGSAWTYDGTEVHDLMLEQKVPHGEVHYDDSRTFGLFGPNGEFQGEQRQKLERLWKDYAKYSKEMRNHLKDTQTDRSYQSILDHYLVQHKEELSDTETRFLKTMIHAQIEIEYAAPASLVSGRAVAHRANDCIFCNADYYTPVMGGGFDKILQPLLQPVRKQLQLQRVVTHIDSDQGKVVYKDRLGREHIQYARTILLTVPIGVLRKERIQFQPPLPQAKKDAIHLIGFGVLNKCVLYWDEDQSSWWPHGKEVLEFVNDDVSFTTFFNEKELGNGGHHVLSAWIGGKEAAAIEELSDEAIVTKVIHNLQTMMGGSTTTSIPMPKHHVISRWGHDEFAYGSYSFDTVARDGLVDIARRELGARTGDKLFWAGEATHKGWFGTTVGAYRSGITAAEDISLTLQHKLDPSAAAAVKTIK